MSSRVADALRRGRRDAHKELCVPVLYIAAPGATPLPCTVRPQLLPGANGRPGGTAAGAAAAQQAEAKPRLIFSADDAPTMIRNQAIVSVEPGVAYRIAFVHPPHDIFIAAEVSRLSAADAVGLPVP